MKSQRMVSWLCFVAMYIMFTDVMVVYLTKVAVVWCRTPMGIRDSGGDLQYVRASHRPGCCEAPVCTRPHSPLRRSNIGKSAFIGIVNINSYSHLRTWLIFGRGQPWTFSDPARIHLPGNRRPWWIILEHPVKLEPVLSGILHCNSWIILTLWVTWPDGYDTEPKSHIPMFDF